MRIRPRPCRQGPDRPGRQETLDGHRRFDKSAPVARGERSLSISGQGSNPRKRDQGLESLPLYAAVRFQPHGCRAAPRVSLFSCCPQDVDGISLAWETRNTGPTQSKDHRGVAVTRLALLARAAILALAAFGATAPPAAGQQRSAAPEAATGWSESRLATARSYMVSAANPLAAQAGADVLREGGSAADAAVAVQLVLNLVEPQSSGLGGGAFILHWDAAGRQLTGYDGRETAPAAARPDRFLVDGRPRRFDDAVFGGLSVGVPGTLRVLEMVHKRHGRLPWARLVAPAIRLAAEGFRVSPRLHLLLRWHGAEAFAPASRRYFFDTAGSARPAGYLLKNPELAETLRLIAERGADALYEGAPAQAIVKAVSEAPNHRGDIAPADLAGYRAKEREPVCVNYRRH